jgi:outer membrane lipoprotein-sorting protein
MKRLVSLGLVAMVVATLALSLPPRSNAQGAGLVSSMLNKLDGNWKSLRSLRANISLEKYNAQLRYSDKQQGVMAYVPGAGRNAFVRLEWQSPQHEIITVGKGQYMAYRPRLKTVYIGKTTDTHNKAGSVLELMNMSRSQLQSRFDQKDAYNETLWGGVKTIHLTVIPKGPASYKYAEIWVDDASGMPVQTKVVEKNDDATTVRLTNTQRNAPVSMDEFTLKLDSDVKRVKT